METSLAEAGVELGQGGGCSGERGLCPERH